jgi:hypothetical protein
MGCAQENIIGHASDMAEVKQPSADGGSLPPPSSGGPSQAACYPGAHFCSGPTSLSMCAASGLQSDSPKVADCTGGSATNPAVCDVTGASCVGSDAGHGCCAPRYATCSFSVSGLGGSETQGNTYELPGSALDANWCHSSTTNNATIDFVVHDDKGNTLAFRFDTTQLDRTPGDNFGKPIRRGVAYDQTYFSLTTSGNGGCSAWTGSVIWKDNYLWPAWGVDFQAKCIVGSTSIGAIVSGVL